MIWLALLALWGCAFCSCPRGEIVLPATPTGRQTLLLLQPEVLRAMVKGGGELPPQDGLPAAWRAAWRELAERGRVRLRVSDGGTRLRVIRLCRVEAWVGGRWVELGVCHCSNLPPLLRSAVP